MKEAVSSFDLIAVVAELQSLVGGHIDKVYQSESEFHIKVNVPGGGRQEVYIRPGKWLCLRERAEKPEEPPPFAKALRRHLDNATITAISQVGFDRVVVFDVEREKKYRLVIELFGGGNFILVEDGKTILCQRAQVLKNRQIRPGQPYDFPPAGVNPLDLGRDEFREKIRAVKGPIASILATALNLGGLYAEELCLVAGVDRKYRVSTLADEQLDALFTALNNLIVAVQEDRRPALILDQGKAINAVPVELQTYVDKERQTCATFSEALSKYLESMGTLEVEKKIESQEDIAAKYQRRIEQQEESIKTLKQEQAVHELKAHFLYGHFKEFDELLTTVREGREPPGLRITAIDHERRTVTVPIGEDDSIELDYRRDVNGNAQILYEKRREAQERAARVEAALSETRQEMEQAVRRARKVEARTKVKPTREFWFETYRWFISSEGFLVIGGRDARSNESVVRRHMKEGDRYAHADTHGAPSVVVKDGSKAGEQTLREACEFALIHSKAWSSQLATGSAYWVTPEQVSKTPESGEYVPKGAFIIRGKRNYLKGLPVRVAIGEIEHEGHRKVMAGPQTSIAVRARRYVILEPGEMSKEKVTRVIAREFDVPVEEVARVLPPGSFRVAEAAGVDLQSDAR